MTCELENPYILIFEDKVSSAKNLIPLLEIISKKKRTAHHHSGRRRGRGPGDPRAEQAQGHSSRVRPQGAGLRRPPQGHDGRHRHPDRRQGHLQGPSASSSTACNSAIWAGQEGQDRRREHDHHRRRGKKPAIDGRVEMIRREITRPTANTTARSCKSGWPSWPAAWPR